MSFARDVYTATGGQTDFTITFGYREETHVLVYQNGTLLTQGASEDYTFFDASTIRFTSGATASDTVILQRSTSQSTRLVDYTAGDLSEADLDNDSFQAFYMAQEAIDIANLALPIDTDDQWTANTKRIKDVTDPTDDQDAATKSYVDDGIATAVLGDLASPISVALGGTGSTTESAARTALGLAIGSDVQGYDADTAKLDVAQTWAAAQNLADYQLTRAYLKDYAETINAIGSIGGGTQDIDLENGNVVSGTVDTSSTTFTFSNPPATGRAGSFTLILTNGGSQTITWPASVDWPAGAAPALTSSGVDVLTFFTLDAGTTWYGFVSGRDMQ